jgi:chemotaxis protein CheD
MTLYPPDAGPRTTGEDLPRPPVDALAYPRESNGRAAAYLHPGQFFAAAQPTAVTTILGSCVAICLWDPSLGVGGINHYLLPHWAGGAESSPRFGNVAFSRLMERLRALGAQPQNLQAKVFGGACVVEAFRGQHLGSKNVEVARRLLQEAGIPVVQEDVGGRKARKLVFHVDDGATAIKLL